jgi:hypothetical protein
MAHEITLVLSDEEYAAVAAEAAASGETVEALLRAAVAQRFAAPTPPP